MISFLFGYYFLFFVKSQSFNTGCGLLNYETYKSIEILPANLGYSVSGLYNDNLYIIGGYINNIDRTNMNMNIYKLNIPSSFIGYDATQSIDVNINTTWDILPLNIPNGIDSDWYKSECPPYPCALNVLPTNGFYCERSSCYTQIDNLLYIVNPQFHGQYFIGNQWQEMMLNALLIYDMKEERFMNSSEYNYSMPYQFYPIQIPGLTVVVEELNNDVDYAGGCVVNNGTHIFSLDAQFESGEIQESSLRNVFQIYDTVNDRWYADDELNKPIHKRSKHMCTVSDDNRYIYLIGGIRGDIEERDRIKGYEGLYWNYSVNATERYDTWTGVSQYKYIIYFIRNNGCNILYIYYIRNLGRFK